MRFRLHSSFSPRGDQPDAIAKLVDGIRSGLKRQTLLGVTGSGKTFTIASVIAEIQKPTLVISHNKTLAAQLFQEFKQFFPENAVEYFVSYYDYYQPEAYIPSSNTYIEKDASINEEIDRLRHSSTASVLTRRDVIVVASVSCIYGLGSPAEYKDNLLVIEKDKELCREEIIRKLLYLQYKRVSHPERSAFRLRGEMIEIYPPAQLDTYYRLEFWGDRISAIYLCKFSPFTILKTLEHLVLFPANHFLVGLPTLNKAIESIRNELKERVSELQNEGKYDYAERLSTRTLNDLEQLAEFGWCPGIENYSRHLDGRAKGEPPFTLLDYFPRDFLIVIDESHVTLPQIRGMYLGDRSRKQTLVEYGFRLPSALDNRPLTYEEFCERINQIIYVSATPAEEELKSSQQVVEQIIRPTGLVDPEVEVRPKETQIKDLLNQIKERVAQGERTLVTTLTKRMAEELTAFLIDSGIKARYLHCDIETLKRVDLLSDLRSGEFDVMVGINLLREGLDLPEVSLVAILDADKEGFLRSPTSLIQTIGRAARNVRGKVILYAEKVTEAMEKALEETKRRRELQLAYNRKYNITPQTIHKGKSISIIPASNSRIKKSYEFRETKELLKQLEKEMKRAAQEWDFKRAEELKNTIEEIKRELS